MRKRMLSLATILAVMVVMLMPAPVMAASSGGMLLKNVKYYDYNTTVKKYKLYSKTSYTYEKGYPVEYNTISYIGDDQSSNTVKYKFKKGLPKSAKHYNDIKRNDEKWTYDKKGRITKRVYGYKFWDTQKRTRTYKYNKQGFVSQYNYASTSKWPGEKARNYSNTYYYKYTMKNGLPNAMEATCIEKYSDGSTDTYRYRITYNSKGLITKMQGLRSDGTLSDYYQTVKYKTKKGKVTQAIVSETYNGKTTPEDKYVFTYTKDKISKARLANMINSYVTQGTGYGVYNWY